MSKETGRLFFLSFFYLMNYSTLGLLFVPFFMGLYPCLVTQYLLPSTFLYLTLMNWVPSTVKYSIQCNAFEGESSSIVK